MMKNLTIKGWRVWQTYRTDRGAPPWIKVHRVLLSNKKWAMLSDSEKGQLISIWLVASTDNGEILSDSKIIKKICLLDDEPDLEKFIQLGFLLSNDVKVTPTGRQGVTPEKKRGEENRIEKENESASFEDAFIPFEEFWILYPRRQNKEAARKAWKKLKVDSDLFQEIKVTLGWQKETQEWKKDNGQYVPYGSSYLNQKRWEDECENTPDSKHTCNDCLDLADGFCGGKKIICKNFVRK